MRIVFEIGKLSALEASCWRVLVVNGRGAFFVRSPFFTSSTANFSPRTASVMRSISSFDVIARLPFSSPWNLAIRGFLSPWMASVASSVQYSSGIKAPISSSLSQMMRSCDGLDAPGT